MNGARVSLLFSLSWITPNFHLPSKGFLLKAEYADLSLLFFFALTQIGKQYRRISLYEKSQDFVHLLIQKGRIQVLLFF